jgi:hypothetical protein
MKENRFTYEQVCFAFSEIGKLIDLKTQHNRRKRTSHDSEGSQLPYELGTLMPIWYYLRTIGEDLTYGRIQAPIEVPDAHSGILTHILSLPSSQRKVATLSDLED